MKAACNLSSQAPESGRDFRLDRTTSTILRCAASGDEYRVFIALPEGEPPTGGWPVLYLLDASSAFGTCVEALRRMGRRQAATGVAPMVVVGISTPDGYDVARRQRDYTTPGQGQAQRQGANGARRRDSGGAEDFLAFLKDAVAPWVAGIVAVDPARATLCGHSLAGFFTLWVLANRPGIFRNYAAISPSVWWDKPALIHEPGRAGTAGRRALILMGEWEDELPPWQKAAPDAASVIARRKARGMVAGAREVAEHFSAVLGAGNVRFSLLAEEDHASILSAAVPRVLRLASQD